MDDTGFALADTLDASALGGRFATTRRLQFGPFLASAGFDRLTAEVAAVDDWIHVINGERSLFEIPVTRFDALPQSERAPIAAAVDASAARGFQFSYDTIRVPDIAAERIARDRTIDRFARFLSSVEALDFFRAVTGDRSLVFADAQATRYRAGDFLTRHDDKITERHRRFAYVLGLSGDWRAEWGGLLHFLDSEGNVVECVQQRANHLSLFEVGQQHFVGQVAGFAPAHRLCITGWLRSQSPA